MWLLQLVLPIFFNCATSFSIHKPFETFDSKSISEINLINSLEKSLDYNEEKDGLRRDSDIFVPPDAMDWKFVFPDIDHLLSSLNIPGYSVYRLNLNDVNEKQSTYDNDSTFMKPRKIKPLLVKLNKVRKLFDKTKSAQKGPTVIFTTKAPDNEVLFDQYFKNAGKNEDNKARENYYKEWFKTTTGSDVLYDTTTKSDYTSDNYKTTTDYDDGEYGSIADRFDVPTGVLASMLG